MQDIRTAKTIIIHEVDLLNSMHSNSKMTNILNKLENRIRKNYIPIKIHSMLPCAL